MQAFGFTTETMQFMLLPLLHELREPVGSMGNDALVACRRRPPPRGAAAPRRACVGRGGGGRL